MAKWTIIKSIGPANNEQPGIEWSRTGIAALGEPNRVHRIEYFDAETQRDFALLNAKGPVFAFTKEYKKTFRDTVYKTLPSD